jgi:hypothetical protein
MIAQLRAVVKNYLDQIPKNKSEGMVGYICLCNELNTVTIAFPGMSEINSSNFC